MNCKYCRAHNEDDAHRCHRCGRRLMPGSGPALEIGPSRSALARELHHQPEPVAPAPPAPTLRIVPPPEAPRAPEPSGPAIQASLFGPQEVARASHPQARVQRTPQPARPRREKVEHPTLDFGGDTVRTLKTSVAAAIYCDAPVALSAWRAMAAIIDTLVGVSGVAVFAFVFHIAGYSFEWTKATGIVFLLAAVLISLLYRVLFCLGNADTPGLRITNLCLVDVGGHLPKRRARFYRLAGGCVGFMAMGIGLLWALFDEERLTWHDHMSNTFPTLRTLDDQH